MGGKTFFETEVIEEALHLGLHGVSVLVGLFKRKALQNC
jgi:hypothetical protein